MKESKQKNIIIGSLIAVVLVMAIGYAAFATQLNINGSAAITSNWCVGFDNTKTSTYTTTTGVSGATAPTGTMSYSGNTCQSVASTVATLNSTLHQPGDRVVYTLTILNKGSVDATIDSVLVDDVAKTASYTETKGNIKFTVTMPVSNTIVATSGSTTMTVTAEFQNDTPVSSLDQAETQSINIKINAGEGSGSGESGSGFTGTIYRNNGNVLANGLAMNGEATIYYPSDEYSSASDALNDGWFYPSESDCLNDSDTNDNCASGTVTLSPGEYTTDASELNKTYYLKHTIVNDIVTASYVCFVTDTEHCMQGGGYDSTAGTSSYYAANKTLLQGQESWFNNNSGSCSFGGSGSNCRGGDFQDVRADLYGMATTIFYEIQRCDVSLFGYSYCGGSLSDGGSGATPK